MRPSFDLVTEPWIPCVTAGGRPAELGLLDTLLRAHELREIADPSPLVTASIHRLLLAILHRNFGPASPDEWQGLWQAGAFDSQRLTEYFDQWRHRFDLFDEERPFYQMPGMPEKMLAPIARLAQEVASGNNPTLFDHTLDEDPRPLTPPQAARLLVAFQACALGGLCSDESGRTSAKAAALTSGATMMLGADTLFRTLVLNLVSYDPANDRPFPCGRRDRPAWERDGPAKVEERVPEGYLDYLTWQSRRIWLEPAEDAPGEVTVSQGIIGDGARLPDDCNLKDPMMAYEDLETTSGSGPPWRAARFGEGTSLWRDSLSLLGALLSGGPQPQVVTEKAALTRAGVLSADDMYDLNVYGLGSSKAKIFLWRHERQPLPMRYLADEGLVDHLRTCLEHTEDAHKGLWGSLCAVAEQVQTAGVRSPDREAVASWVQGSQASGFYWSSLELPFRQLVVELAADKADRYELESRWAEHLGRVAWEAFDLASDGLAPNARNLRAISEARRILGGRLKKIIQPYKEVDMANEE